MWWRGSSAWEVSTTLRSQHPREYQAIPAFLSSIGPLLSACHRLPSDPYIRYEFPVYRLSPSIICQVSTLSVYIVQPYTLDNRLVAGESLYPHKQEDYLFYYLPCDGTTPPPLPFQLSLPSSPGQGSSPQDQQPDQPPAR